MSPSRSRRIAGATAVLVALFFGAATVGQDDNRILLVTKDGGSSVVVELLGFEPGFYLVATAYGELKIAMSEVECVGAACPDPAHARIASELWAKE